VDARRGGEELVLSYGIHVRAVGQKGITGVTDSSSLLSHTVCHIITVINTGSGAEKVKKKTKKKSHKKPQKGLPSLLVPRSCFSA